ncbi:4Fe-4S dicluster domain-containing protein [Nocardia vaccinii]|uniref:4Fe-4S dicluster domain-containing protein n=1 Tax=Nocardia vaccinii TaxID=1822 RepID=UPI001470A122|nr:4Fe-4S dicluster domain-containing protein [Nocardia vaccinii]
MPDWLCPSLRSPATWWDETITPPPAELQTVAGIRRDPDQQDAIRETTPLYDFFHLHSDARALLSSLWVATVSIAPRLQRAGRARRRHNQSPLTRRPSAHVDSARLTEDFKSYCKAIGLSAVGVTAYDPNYQFVEYRGNQVGDVIVVGIIEQNYESTQQVPSIRSERAALAAYGELERRMLLAAEWLTARGYRARPEGYIGESLTIAYAVEAGLGQLGLNGQLLTPAAGSRARLHVMSTNAPLSADKPVDYGIEGVCDKCQICVRRCPVGAIPATRSEHRGVVKAKLNTKRCLPIMAQASGCSICMKVCPVQRFGLNAVLAEYENSGQILGKDTDDLEGYDWPVDGKHYPPGVSPKVPVEMLRPNGFLLDTSRKDPLIPAPPNAEPGGY